MTKWIIVCIIVLALPTGMALSAIHDQSSNYTQARTAIYKVFGSYSWQAMRVAHCETGGTYDPRASNGQYQGIFQMGSYERSRYGHGRSWLAQARAAYRYFVASGRDWSPWACKP